MTTCPIMSRVVVRDHMAFGRDPGGEQAQLEEVGCLLDNCEGRYCRADNMPVRYARQGCVNGDSCATCPKSYCRIIEGA
jgi:hypothetical protein